MRWSCIWRACPSSHDCVASQGGCGGPPDGLDQSPQSDMAFLIPAALTLTLFRKALRPFARQHVYMPTALTLSMQRQPATDF
jgi:hypothetical protein